MATNKELYAKLSSILEEAEAKIREAEEFAEANQLEFSFGAPGAPKISYYPHSENIRANHEEKTYANEMVLGYEEEPRKVEPLKEHKTEIYYNGNYYNDPPFQGGWWVPSRFC